jgi:EmrB/QacA subfamily drug resistance transporter
MLPTAQAATNAQQSSVSTRTLFLAVFPSIMLPMFLAAIDQTIVSTALPSIAGTLGDVERISWVVVSYLVATTIAAPVYGRLGDVLGRRRLLFVALAIFILASLFCALSTSALMLSAARVLQGLGGGGLMTLSQALVGEAVPPRQRGRFQGYLASVYMCASTLGPVAGGWLTQHFGWQSVFLINLPLGLVAIGMALRLPRRPPAAGKFHFDFIGVGLFTLFIGPTLLALEQAQRFDLATVPLILMLAMIAAVALVLLLRQERRAAMPLLPVALLRQTAIWRTNAMAACLGATIVSLITFLPIYLEVVRSIGPSDTGVLMLPLTAFVALGSMFTGRMVSKTGRSAIFPSCGLLVVILALVVLALFAPHLGVSQLPWLFAMIAIPLGTVMPVVQVTVQMLAGPQQLGAASASVQFSRSIGAAFGTALVGTALFAMLAATDLDTAHLFARIVELGPQALAGLPAARIATVQAEIAGAFRAAFLTIAGFAMVGATLAWSIPVRRI